MFSLYVMMMMVMMMMIFFCVVCGKRKDNLSINTIVKNKKQRFFKIFEFIFLVRFFFSFFLIVFFLVFHFVILKYKFQSSILISLSLSQECKKST